MIERLVHHIKAKEDGGEPSSFTLLKRGESLVIYQNIYEKKNLVSFS